MRLSIFRMRRPIQTEYCVYVAAVSTNHQQTAVLLCRQHGCDSCATRFTWGRSMRLHYRHITFLVAKAFFYCTSASKVFCGQTRAKTLNLHTFQVCTCMRLDGSTPLSARAMGKTHTHTPFASPIFDVCRSKYSTPTAGLPTHQPHAGRARRPTLCKGLIITCIDRIISYPCTRCCCIIVQ